MNIVTLKSYFVVVAFIMSFSVLGQSHDKIMNTRPESLIDEYGQEKALKLIREHCLIGINDIRKKHNLKPLKMDSLLCSKAHDWIRYLYATGTFTHVSDNGLCYRLIVHRNLKKTSYYPLDDTLGGGIMTIKEFLEAQMASPPHRRIILEKQYAWENAYNVFGMSYFRGLYMMGFGDKLDYFFSVAYSCGEEEN